MSVVDLSRHQGIRGTVDLLLHEEVGSPATCGFVRPAILFPVDAQEWADEELRSAMVHELERMRRADSIVHLMARVACAVYWFHPLAWIAWRHLCLEAEHACDDAVLQGAERTRYAQQLVGLAPRLSAETVRPVVSMASGSNLQARVSAVLDAGRARGRAGMLQTARGMSRWDGSFGPKLRQSEVSEAACAARRAAIRRNEPVPPVQPGVVCGTGRSRPGNIGGHRVPVGWLTDVLGPFVGRVVLDRTGLTGLVDLDLEWTPDPIPETGPDDPDPPRIDPNGPSIFSALQEQLGLMLESTKGPVEILVIDQVWKSQRKTSSRPALHRFFTCSLRTCTATFSSTGP